MAKGSAFEREVCKKLSLWWTHGERDDVFWRTAGSGARATTRSKGGRKTFGQYGDVQATDPIGQPLIDLFSIEIKRGYPQATLSTVLDASPKMKRQPLLLFADQALRSCEQSGAWSWMVIHKRDQRKATVLIPNNVIKAFPNLSTIGRLALH